MRHDDREAAILAREPRDPARRSVRVGRIALGRISRAVHVAHGDEALGGRALRMVAKLRVTFAVRGGHRYAAARHAGEEERWRLHHLDHDEPGLELLRAIAHEMRP